MSSPAERWNQLASPDRLELPVDPDELEIICSDADERVISHEGIKWRGTMFQSPALQQLRRRLPEACGSRVTVRCNGHMARIWVRDPADGSHLEVLNTDPDTKDLTVQQILDLDAVRGKAGTPGRLTAAEGRKRMKDYVQQLQDCKNKKAKRALLRILNVVPAGPGQTAADERSQSTGSTQSGTSGGGSGQIATRPKCPAAKPVQPAPGAQEGRGAARPPNTSPPVPRFKTAPTSLQSQNSGGQP